MDRPTRKLERGLVRNTEGRLVEGWVISRKGRAVW